MFEEGKWYVDPVKGHEYGFPRIYEKSKDGDMEKWLIEQGYPIYLYHAYYDFIRVWRCRE